MSDIRVADNLWSTSIFPEGILERWLVQNGSTVAAGQAVATIRVNDALHEVVAPTHGRLTVTATALSVVEPGTLIAQLAP